MRFYSVLVSVVVALGAMGSAYADRDGKWEFTGSILAVGSEDSSGRNGASLDVDSAVGWGFGVTYNFNSRFAVGLDTFIAQPDYVAVFNSEDDGLVSFKHKLDFYNTNINATFYLSEGRLAPYVQAGIGWSYVDSNVSNGRPQTGCWWDPWWGYVCANFYDTFDDTSFSYGGAVGLRLELGQGLFLKGSYNYTELNTDADTDPSFNSFKVELGWSF